MGQLDQIELNELFFIGYFVSIIPVYVSGGLESTLENVKIYIFSAVAAIAPGVANIPNKNPQNTYKIEYVRVEPRESRYWEVIVVPSSSSGNELNFRPGATFTTNNGKNRGVVFLAHETDPWRAHCVLFTGKGEVIEPGDPVTFTGFLPISLNDPNFIELERRFWTGPTWAIASLKMARVTTSRSGKISYTLPAEDGEGWASCESGGRHKKTAHFNAVTDYNRIFELLEAVQDEAKYLEELENNKNKN